MIHRTLKLRYVIIVMLSVALTARAEEKAASVQSLTIQDCISRALQNNLEIKFERIKFYEGDEIARPTQGQAFFYFGNDVRDFQSAFCKIGFGVAPLWQYDTGPPERPR